MRRAEVRLRRRFVRVAVVSVSSPIGSSLKLKERPMAGAQRHSYMVRTCSEHSLLRLFSHDGCFRRSHRVFRVLLVAATHDFYVVQLTR